MEDWAEKYRPKHLEDIIGNEKATSQLRRWAETWKKTKTPSKKAVVLSGKAGIGKTSSALALANDYNWTPIELNASDARNAIKIKAIATSGAVNETFDNQGNFITSKTGGRKLIILDEADNLYEKSDKNTNQNNLSDKGGKKAIIDTIKNTNQPIILIVNDYYSLIKGGGEPLKEMCQLIRYYPLYLNSIADHLKKICIEEQIHVEYKTLRTIADRCSGDIRSAINDLQSISFNKNELDIQSLDVLGYRDREKIIFDVLREIFKTKNLQAIRENTINLDETPDTLLLWLNENLPREYIAVDDLARGYNALSTADLFLGRVNKRKNFSFWGYASDIMNGGIALAKTHEYSNNNYQFPIWLRNKKKARSSQSTREIVISKIGALCHNSEYKSKEHILSHFRQLFQNNNEFAHSMKKKLDLSDEEIVYLLGKKYEHKLNEINQPQLIISENEKIQINSTEKKEGRQQPSLFDF